MIKKITVKDVAKHADVGIGTVSRVLNNNKNVKPHIRKKVEDAIKELGYQPDSIARSLRTKQSKTVAFFVPDISNPAFATISKGVHDLLENHGYNLILYNTGTTNMKEKVFDFFATRKVDGAILAFNEEDNPAINKFLSDLTTPLLILDRELPGILVDSIYTDYYGGVKNAVEYLIRLGHRNIGFVMGSPAIRPVRESLRGYMDALKLNDISINHEWIQTGEFTTDFGQSSMRTFLNAIEKRELTAVFTGGYSILVGCLEIIQQEQIKVPEDISIIAFEDSDLAKLMNPSITVIRRNLYDMGKKMAYFLLDRISNNKERFNPSSMIVPTELVIRSSTMKLER